MSLSSPFYPGMLAIPAKALTSVARAAERTERSDAPPGGPLTPPAIAPIVPIPVFVRSRTADQATALINHEYTIIAAGDEHRVNWRNLYVTIPYPLIDPQGAQNIPFMPAAVVGDSIHAEQPWRAQGLLYRMPGLVDGSPTAMVWLWGLAPSYGCE